MKSSLQQHSGFTLIELLITIAIIGILAAIAIPSYQNYTRKSAFTEIVNATAPYKLGVAECYQNTSNLTLCNTAANGAGQNGVPPAVTTSAGIIGSITVTNGIITATPAGSNNYGVPVEATYILQPNVDTTNPQNPITWTITGGAVNAGYVSGVPYTPPTGP